MEGGKASFWSYPKFKDFYDRDRRGAVNNGNNIKELDLDSLRDKIAYIPHIHICNDTIAKNIAYGKELIEIGLSLH